MKSVVKTVSQTRNMNGFSSKLKLVNLREDHVFFTYTALVKPDNY